MQRFRDLKVWERSHALVLEIYRATERFPSEERYGVVSQIRRAAVSVPTNIAEGSRRDGGKDFSRFLNLAEASMAEVDYLLLLSGDLGYLPREEVKRLAREADEIQRMLHGLRDRVARSAEPSRAAVAGRPAGHGDREFEAIRLNEEGVAVNHDRPADPSDAEPDGIRHPVDSRWYD